MTRMASRHVHPLIQQLRRAALLADGAGQSDAQLLEGYIARRDPAAFEALVRRHGPMVFGVCRRLLRDPHDAEDAFQATFLVLVRKAASVVPRAMLANWLYGVAHTTALRARVADARRRARVKPTSDVPEPEPVSPDRSPDLRPLLDAELALLPEKYRTPVVLCDLEGKTRKEAARQLRWPEGTLSSRLARARALLARRLARRGLPVSGAALAAVLCHQAASASVPASLTMRTAAAAGLFAADAGLIPARLAALTKGVLTTMLVRTLTRFTIGLVAVASLALVGGVATWQTPAAGQDSPFKAFAQATPASKPGDDNLKNTLVALETFRWEAGARGDWEAQAKLHADDFVAVSGYGRSDKASNIATFKQLRFADWKLRDMEVRRVSNDVAVMTYVYDSKALTPDGVVVQVRRNHRASMVWALRDGGWVIVFAQETILPGGQ
jgi:RNA polymerase sigma factor (sigma-70 family)